MLRVERMVRPPVSRVSRREGRSKGRALAGRAHEVHLAAVLADDLPGDRQPEAGAACIRLLVDPEERQEDVVPAFFRDADPSSSTETTKPAVVAARRVTETAPPSGEYLSAFDSRLPTTWPTRRRSARRSSGSPGSSSRSSWRAAGSRTPPPAPRAPRAGRPLRAGARGRPLRACAGSGGRPRATRGVVPGRR